MAEKLEIVQLKPREPRGIERYGAKATGFYSIPFTFIRLKKIDGSLINPFDYTWKQLIGLAESRQLWNPRSDYKDIPALAEYIFDKGAVPGNMKGATQRHEGENCFVPNDGHRRTVSLVMLRDTGRLEVVERSITIYLDKAKTDSECLYSAMEAGSGEPLTYLDKAAIVTRLIAAGEKADAIAKRIPRANGQMGVSRMSVYELSVLGTATPATQELIKKNLVSASQVVELLREDDDPLVVERVLSEIIEQRGAIASPAAPPPDRITKKEIEAHKRKTGPSTPVNMPPATDMVRFLRDLPLELLPQAELYKLYKSAKKLKS